VIIRNRRIVMKRLRKKILFYKALLVEIVETLCSICLYLESDRVGRYNPHSIHMRDHFYELKKASKELRDELAERKEE
jgi:hypothetical protein